MKKLQDLKTDIDTSIQFVAAQYKYAKDLQVQLQRIDNEPGEKALADARKGFRILRWITRAERKAYKSEEEIGKRLDSLGRELPEKLRGKEEKLKTNLQLIERNILRIADRYRGELQTELRDIITEEELLLTLKKGNTAKLRSELGLLFTQTNRHVDELILWVSAMEEILREIRGFEQELEAAA